MRDHGVQRRLCGTDNLVGAARLDGTIPAARPPGMLTADRALALWRLITALLITGALALAVAAYRQYQERHLGPALDYVAFWTAGRLALQGHAAASYDGAVIGPAQRAAVFMGAPNYFPFFYPPPSLFLFAPFALLPYGLAFAAFAAAQWGLLTGLLRRLLPPPWPASSFVLAPAMLLDLGLGQNGGWTAAGMAAGAMLLERRPALAGCALGLLALKPHVAILVPVALAAAARWRALAFAAATLTALVAGSLVFGPACWGHFFAAGMQARGVVEQVQADWGKMISPFAASRLAGAGLGLAYAVQTVAALAASAALILCRRAAGAWLIAALAAATTLLSPYLFDYDLPLTLVPLALIAARGTTQGWLRYERPVCAAVFLSPLLLRPIALQTSLGLAPFFDAALLALVARRARAEPRWAA